MNRRTTSLRTGLARANGSVLLEVSIAMGVAALVALMMMKASLLALSNNQWTIMQTLTDAYLTRETALSNRVPVGDLTAENSLWPDQESDEPPQSEQTVEIGRLAGGRAVTARLIRFRMNETPAETSDVALAVWRLHSVLSYSVGGKEYLKSRSTLRTQ